MTISRVTSGKHRGEFRVRIQPVDKLTGKQVCIPIQYVKSQREAKKAEQAMWARFRNGYTYNPSVDSLYDCFKEFVDSEYKQGRWTERTYHNWQYSVKMVKEFLGNVKLRDVNENLMREFARKVVAERNIDVSPNSVLTRSLIHLRAFFKRYVGGIFEHNPIPEGALNRFFRIDEFSVKHERYVLKAEEISALLTEIEREFNDKVPVRCVSQMAIYVDLLTGMRPQELQTLRWDNLRKLDDDSYSFEIDDSWDESAGKANRHLKYQRPGETRLVVPFGKNELALINRYRQSQADFLKRQGLKNTKQLVFLSLDNFKKCAEGYPVTQTALNKELRMLGKTVGINPDGKTWSMYSIRHTVATKLANTPNMRYPWAAARLGHRVDTFMQTYVHEDQDVAQKMSQLWLTQKHTVTQKTALSEG